MRNASRGADEALTGEPAGHEEGVVREIGVSSVFPPNGEVLFQTKPGMNLIVEQARRGISGAHGS